MVVRWHYFIIRASARTACVQTGKHGRAEQARSMTHVIARYSTFRPAAIGISDACRHARSQLAATSHRVPLCLSSHQHALAPARATHGTSSLVISATIHEPSSSAAPSSAVKQNVGTEDALALAATVGRCMGMTGGSGPGDVATKSTAPTPCSDACTSSPSVSAFLAHSPEFTKPDDCRLGFRV